MSVWSFGWGSEPLCSVAKPVLVEDSRVGTKFAERFRLELQWRFSLRRGILYCLWSENEGGRTRARFFWFADVLFLETAYYCWVWNNWVVSVEMRLSTAGFSPQAPEGKHNFELTLPWILSENELRQVIEDFRMILFLSIRSIPFTCIFYLFFGLPAALDFAASFLIYVLFLHFGVLFLYFQSLLCCVNHEIFLSLSSNCEWSSRGMIS